MKEPKSIWLKDMRTPISPINSEEVVTTNIGLVYKVVNKLKVSSFDRDDLIQAGLMGLFKAAQRFDNSKGFAFSTYAMPFIVGNIKKELRQDRIIRISTYFQPLIKSIAFENDCLSYQEMATKYNTTVENVAIACGHVSGVISLDKIENLGITIPFFNKNTIDFSILTPNEERLIKLRFYENLSQSEIAKRLKLSQTTISRKLKKIMNKLRKG